MNISEKKRFSLVFSFLAIILLPFVSAQYFGFLDFYSLSDMYETYYQWFDLIIYYMIFGSLARLVFEKRFGENEHAVTALYNGVAIFMSLGLVLYESRFLNDGKGGPLLLVGGIYIFLIALLIAAVGLCSILRALTGWGFFRCAIISALIILFLAYGLRDVSGLDFSETLNNIIQWLFLIVIGGAIILGTLWAVRGHNPSPSPTIVPEPRPIKPRNGEESDESEEDKRPKEIIISVRPLIDQFQSLNSLIVRIATILGRAVNLVEKKEDELGPERTKVRIGLVARIIPPLRKLEANAPIFTKLKSLLPHLERTDLAIDQRLQICREIRDSLKVLKSDLNGLKRKRRIIRIIDKFIISYYINRQYAHTEDWVVQAFGITKAVLNEIDGIEKKLRG